MRALTFPAYIITSTWDVLDHNDAFARVWGIQNEATPFNAIERLFLHPLARKMHGDRFESNIRPVIAMVSVEPRPPSAFAADARCSRTHRNGRGNKGLWDEYEITNPLLPVTVTIDSPLGACTYQTLTVPIEGTLHGIVVQVPDENSRSLFTSGDL